MPPEKSTFQMLAQINVFVKTKINNLGTKINANAVKVLRQNIPFGGQGTFITTCDYQNSTQKIAVEPG